MLHFKGLTIDAKQHNLWIPMVMVQVQTNRIWTNPWNCNTQRKKSISFKNEKDGGRIKNEFLFFGNIF